MSSSRSNFCTSLSFISFCSFSTTGVGATGTVGGEMAAGGGGGGGWRRGGGGGGAFSCASNNAVQGKIYIRNVFHAFIHDFRNLFALQNHFMLMEKISKISLYITLQSSLSIGHYKTATHLKIKYI